MMAGNIKFSIGILFLLFLILFSSHCFAIEEISFAVDAFYKNGKIIAKGIELVEGRASSAYTGANTAVLLGFNGSKLFRFNFSTSLHVYDAEPLTERPLLLIFPYFPNAKELNLYNEDNRLMLKLDLSSYAVCNQNNLCNPEIGEDAEICPEDCKKATKTISVPKETVEKKTEKKYSIVSFVAILAIIFIVVILLKMLSKKREHE